MSGIQRLPMCRVVGPPDVGDLLRLVAADNPFLAHEEILDRVVITDRIGLLIGGRSDAATLLYVWTRTIEDVSPWIAHAAQWLEQYPIWRKAYGLVSSDAPVRMVLAAPGIEERLRNALGLVARPVTLTRYVCVELGGEAVLGWESGPEPGGNVIAGTALAGQRPTPPHRTAVSDDLTPEELAFFRNG